MIKYSREWWKLMVDSDAVGVMNDEVLLNNRFVRAFADGKRVVHCDRAGDNPIYSFQCDPSGYSIKPEEPEKVKILDVPVLSRTREEWAEVLEATLIGQFPERLARNITTIKAFAEGKTVLISGKIADTTMVFGNPPSDYSIQEDPLAPAWVRPLELRIEKLEKEILEAIDD